MKSELPSHLNDILIRMANHEPDQEICGFIVKRPGERGLFPWPCKNVSSDPAHHFEIGEEQLVSAYEMFESYGNLIGMYHSHPYGPDHPSEADVKYAPPPELRYFIVTLTDVFEYDMENSE